MSNKDIYATIGASNHTDKERHQHDYYATEPKALELLLDVEDFHEVVWECACGGGHLVDVLHDRGYYVSYSDLYDYGYPDTILMDFLAYEPEFGGKVNMDIITNPPYSIAKEFVEHAMDIVAEGRKVAMFLKLTFLESKKRRELFEKYPPKYIYVSSSRLQCAKNGDFETYKKGTGTAIAYAWYVWEKGFKGEPVVRWIN